MCSITSHLYSAGWSWLPRPVLFDDIIKISHLISSHYKETVDALDLTWTLTHKACYCESLSSMLWKAQIYRWDDWLSGYSSQTPEHLHMRQTQTPGRLTGSLSFLCETCRTWHFVCVLQCQGRKESHWALMQCCHLVEWFLLEKVNVRTHYMYVYTLCMYVCDYLRVCVCIGFPLRCFKFWPMTCTCTCTSLVLSDTPTQRTLRCVQGHVCTHITSTDSPWMWLHIHCMIIVQIKVSLSPPHPSPTPASVGLCTCTCTYVE